MIVSINLNIFTIDKYFMHLTSQGNLMQLSRKNLDIVFNS